MSEYFPKDRPVLVLDASGPVIFTGVWQSGQWLADVTDRSAALDAVFTNVQQALEQAQLNIDEIGSFVYDEGPGSVLGIRISAMAIASWITRPALRDARIHTFRSLNWAVRQLGSSRLQSDVFCVIGDYRKNLWLGLNSSATEIEPIGLDELNKLGNGELYHVAQRRSWQPPPDRARPLQLDWQNNPGLLSDKHLLRTVERPEIYSAHQTNYKTWTADRHRGGGN